MFKNLYQETSNLIIILDQHKDTFERKIFKIIHNLHFLLKLSTPIFVVVSE